MKRSTMFAICSVLSVVTACSSGPSSADVTGRGLVSVDALPAEGVRVWNRPSWSVGDRYSYHRAGLVEMTFRVVSANDAGYELEEESSGLMNAFTPDLWVRGQSMPGDPDALLTLDPADAQLTWPLWVGKTWVCHFVRNAPSGAVPIVARYECDALETLDTPAGALECLRIWRRSRLAVEGHYPQKHDLLWYAPAAGFFAQKLEGGILTELQDFDRAR